MEAKQTPLIELLERVPQDARVIVEHDQFSSSSHPVGRLCHEAAAALRAALAEPEQEPVAWRYRGNLHEFDPSDLAEGPVTSLYTAPTPRKPLTDEEIDRVTDQQWAQNNHKPIYAAHRAYARAIERAHGITGETNE